MEQDSLSLFVGRWHPLLVHLPIGMLLMAAVLELLRRYPRFGGVRAAIGPVLFTGMLAAVASCIAGYCLSLSGGYDEAGLSRHQWLGIAVAVLSLILVIWHYRSMAWRIRSKPLLGAALWILMVLGIAAAGHYGGALTHGDDYLIRASPPFLQRWLGWDNHNAAVVVKDVQEAEVYRDVIRPMLASRCYGCHNNEKQKGSLRLDSMPLILEGGENGPALKAGAPEESELFKRIMLPEDDEHHMPPKGKPQLSAHQALLLQWWIAEGAPDDKKVKQLQQPGMVRSLLAALEAGQAREHPFVPVQTVDAAGEQAISALQQSGVRVVPLGSGNNFFKVSAFSDTSFSNAETTLLLPLKKQIAWLQLGRTQINDTALRDVAALSALTRLHLEHTAISDKGIEMLAALPDLRYLNLAGTAITDAGLHRLSELKSLQQLYVYQTAVTADGVQKLQQQLPQLKIDTGGYRINFLPTDTIIYKANY